MIRQTCPKSRLIHSKDKKVCFTHFKYVRNPCSMFPLVDELFRHYVFTLSEEMFNLDAISHLL
jgi:hypothetical protein